MKTHIRLALSLFAVVFGLWFETDPALILDDRDVVWKDCSELSVVRNDRALRHMLPQLVAVILGD